MMQKAGLHFPVEGMKSFRVKMTVMIVLVVLISSGLLSVISYRRAKNSVVSQSEENYRVAADKYAHGSTPTPP